MHYNKRQILKALAQIIYKEKKCCKGTELFSMTPLLHCPLSLYEMNNSVPIWIENWAPQPKKASPSACNPSNIILDLFSAEMEKIWDF